MAGVSVYEYWNLALCDRQISPWGWLQNSLVTVDRKTGKAKLNAEYWGLKHLSHFVKDCASCARPRPAWLRQGHSSGRGRVARCFFFVN